MRKDFEAALGYFEIQLFDECLITLDALTEPERQSEEVLEMQFSISVAKKAWPAALKKGRESIARYPNALFGYLQKSYALHELGKTAQALATLDTIKSKEIARRSPIYQYNRACYAVVTGDSELGQRCIRQAIGLQPQLRAQAMSDPDLEMIRMHL